MTDTEGTITLFNEPAAEMWGRKPEVGKDKWCGSWKIFSPDDGTQVSLDECPMAVALKEGRSVRGQEIVVERPDGTRRNVLPHPQPLRDGNGQIIGALNLLVDITDRKVLEAQLLHAQKMQAIGSLAGGVAHDFNNLLGVILGYAEITEHALPDADPLRENLRQISMVSNRAASLAGQLLAFASKQVVRPKTINVNERVLAGLQMLKRIVGEDIEMVTEFAKDAPYVRIDPSQFDQVLVNLAVNAKDAMPKGGKLRIETSSVLRENDSETTESLTPGMYALMAISDDGCGIPADVLTRVFEPFFTTKELGKGVGLGLSTCYGIANQAGGVLTIESLPGAGTTVKVFLPRVDSLAERAIGGATLESESKCHETLLIAEDQAILLDIAVAALSGLGYKVLPAANGAEAVAIADDYNGEIHLLITDVIMPKITGMEVARLLRTSRPDMKMLFISGYPDDLVGGQGVSVDDENFLAKPFTPSALAARVRKLLDSGVAARVGS